ncbi:MAG: urease accessory protein UreE [Thiohalocapsa sp.]|jgi:urease accessory protein
MRPILVPLTRRADPVAPADAEIALTLDQRSRSRLRVRLDGERDLGILLPRGESLRDGDLLASEAGFVVRVRAADEPVSTARSDDPLLLARACYHLGNRHVPLEIRPGRLRWLRDHVLDAMVRRLGLDVTADDAPFEPETGAYGGPAVGQGHGHRH